MRLYHQALLRCAAALLLAVVCPPPVEGQDKNNFSGTWAASTEAQQGIVAAPSPILGTRFALKLEGETLEVIRAIREESIAVKLRLDGNAGSFKVPGRLCEGETEFVETAAWEGNALALTGVGRIPPGGAVPIQLNVKRLLRLQGSDTLIAEGSMTQGGATRAVATVYKRSADALPAPKVEEGVKGVFGTTTDVAWVSGTWTGVNGNLTVEERWTPAASGAMMGMGRTLRGGQMVSFEFLCIVERGGTLVYVAMPDGRTAPTFFTLTEVTKATSLLTRESATFENPKHDYPKVIRYTKRADGSLETTISGAANQRSQTFVLQRRE